MKNDIQYWKEHISELRTLEESTSKSVGFPVKFYYERGNLNRLPWEYAHYVLPENLLLPNAEEFWKGWFLKNHAPRYCKNPYLAAEELINKYEEWNVIKTGDEIKEG
jgi:hypothetical protein